MNQNKVTNLTDVYLTAYMRALEKTRNEQLAVTVAMGVTAVINLQQPAEKENPLQYILGAMIQAAAAAEAEETDDE